MPVHGVGQQATRDDRWVILRQSQGLSRIDGEKDETAKAGITLLTERSGSEGETALPQGLKVGHVTRLNLLELFVGEIG